jgi:hypothetical protein
MTNNEPDIQTLIGYITERCLSAARQEKKDRFAQYLVEYSEVVEGYFSEREALGDSINSDSDRRIKRILRNEFRSLYESLLSESFEYRREVLSTIVTATKDAKRYNFNAIFTDLLSDLNWCYNKERMSGQITFDLKRFFVRRYSILLGLPLDELKTSETEKQLKERYKIWKETLTQAAELLRKMIEYSDEESYSHLVSTLTDFYPYEMVPSESNSTELGKEIESNLNELKMEYGEKVHSDISVLAFVLTAWAFRLLKNDQISRETYSDINAATQSERSSIETVAEIYYTKIKGPNAGGLAYWEQWNMDEAIEQEMGATFTSMSVHSWIRDFYCAELLRLGGESDWVIDQEDERDNPIPAVREVINESESLANTFNQLKEDSLGEFVTAELADLDRLIEALTQLHENAADQYRDDERDAIRYQVLDDTKKEEFRASLIERFENGCTLRNVMTALSLITVGEVSDDESHHLVDLQVPRRKLVTVDAIPIMDSVQRYVNPIIEGFSKLIFEELEFESVQANSNDQVIRRIQEYSDSRELDAIVTSLGITDQVFRDEPEYDSFVPPDERVFENQRGTYVDTPVISIRYEEPAIVLLFDETEQIVEPDISESPLLVNISPGEETLSDEEKSEMSEDEIARWRDVARAKILYRGRFQPKGTTGVRIMIDDQS